MKLLVDVCVEVKHLEDEGKGFVASVRSRRYNILNEEDVYRAMNKDGIRYMEISVETRNFIGLN